MMRLTTLCCFAWLALVNAPSLADWPQFRGQNSSGIASGEVPIEFGPGKNELWSVPLASGHSSPCIVGDSIFLTTFQADVKRLAVVCLSKENGEVRWQRDLPIEKVEKGHPSFNAASSSPASDGARVVAYFGSYGLICFDMAGEKLWDKKMPLTKSYAGNATSPAIIGDKVILYRGNEVDHFLLAVNKENGEQIWKVDQDEPFHVELACTACPIVVDDKLIMHTARAVQAFNIENGEQIWVTKCATTATSTPVLAGDEVIVAAWNKMGEPALRPKFPAYEELVTNNDKDADKLVSKDEFPSLWIFHRPEGAEAPHNGAPLSFRSVDKNGDGELDADEWNAKLADIEKWRSGYKNHGLLAIPVGSEGVIDLADVRILEQQGIPEVPSPIYHDGFVYLIKNGGVLTCIDVEQGKRVSKLRTKGKGTHYASPVVADGKLFTTAGDGTISVMSLGAKPKMLAVNSMGDGTYATPAIVDGTLYVRTHKRLYAFREREK